MSARPDPPFLHRAAYRVRRIRDGARMLPVLGAVLFMLPMLWSVAEPGASTAGTALYLFGAWAVLIGLARLMAHLLTIRDPGERTADRPDP